MNTRLSTITRAVTIALILAFAVICSLFIPRFADYIAVEILSHGLTRTFIYLGSALLTLPCVIMLIMALRLSSAIASDGIFTRPTSALIARISLILFIDCLLFSTAVIALFAVGESLVSTLLALVDLIGFALAFLLRVLADYIRRAAILKEEADATL